MGKLSLRVREDGFTPQAWEWALYDGDSCVAEHAVADLSDDPEYGGFLDLNAYLAEQALDERGIDAATLAFGRWLANRVFGSAICAELRGAPGETVEIVLTDASRSLLSRPLELVAIDGKPLFRHEISFVYRVGDAPVRRRAEHPGGVRILAVFSQPSEEVPLNLGIERRNLEDLCRELSATGKHVELRILQYGVTEAALEDALSHGDGWDVIHFSGHGGSGFLVLEPSEGGEEIELPAEALAEKIRVGGRRPRLVTLLACASASSAAHDARGWLRAGLAPAVRDRRSRDGDEASPLPGVAIVLAERLGCPVLGMRYAVADNFAGDLGVEVYRGLLERGNGLVPAFQTAMRTALAQGEWSPETATPILVGGPAEVSLAPLLVKPFAHPPEWLTCYACFPPRIDHFVGHVRALSDARRTWSRGGAPAVLFTGLPGLGTTACANELAQCRMAEHPKAASLWHRLSTNEDGSRRTQAGGSLRRFLGELEAAIGGKQPSALAGLADSLEREGALATHLNKMSALLHGLDLFVVLDGLEVLLDSAGRWKDPSWGAVIAALAAHRGVARVVMTSRTVPSVLPQGVRHVALNWLSNEETVLLCLQLPNLGQLMRRANRTGGGPVGDALDTVLDLVMGHPGLIMAAEALAANQDAFMDAAGRIEEARYAGPVGLSVLFGEAAGRTGSAPGAELAEAVAAILRGLDEPTRRFLFLLSCLDAGDLEEDPLDALWTELGGEADWRPLAGALERAGLLAVTRDGLTLRPCVAEVGHANAPAGWADHVTAAASDYWLARYAAHRGNDRERARAARRALVHQLRRGDWQSATRITQETLLSGQAVATARGLLPALQRAVALAGSAPEGEGARGLLAIMQRLAGANDAANVLQSTMESIGASGDPRVVRALCAAEADRMRRSGQLALALTFAHKALDAAASIPDRVPEDIGEEIQVFTLINELGEPYEALSRVAGRLTALDATEREGRIPPDAAAPVREALLSVRIDAAERVNLRRIALEAVRALRASREGRNAGEPAIAEACLRACHTLVARGRFAAALRIVRKAHDTFQEHQDDHRLALALDVWAKLERRRGRRADAVLRGQAALTRAYAAAQADDAAALHATLAAWYEEDGDTPSATAHGIAAALLDKARGIDPNVERTQAIRRTWTAQGKPRVSRKLADLAGRVGIAEELFSGVFRKAGDTEDMLATVLDALRPSWEEGQTHA